MHSYHNVAELRQFHGAALSSTAAYRRLTILAPAAVNLDIEIPYLLSQRVAVEAEQVGGTNLVAPRRRQRRGQQRHLDLLEDAVIEARRRHPVGEAGEMRRQIGFDGAAEIVDAMLDVATRGHGRRRQF